MIKRGGDDLRTLLTQSVESAVMSAAKRSDRISLWLVQLVDVQPVLLRWLLNSSCVCDQ